MDPVHAIVLAVVQGLSEFLPISSSGHLILIPHLFGWPDQGLAFDVAVHVGTLLALLVYFRREIVAMTVAWFGSVFRRRHTRRQPPGLAGAGGHDPGRARGPRVRRRDRGAAALPAVRGGDAVVLRPADVRGRSPVARDARRALAELAAGGRDRLRAGARADAGHVALGHHDHGGTRARARALRRRALLVPARDSGDRGRRRLRGTEARSPPRRGRLAAMAHRAGVLGARPGLPASTC